MTTTKYGTNGTTTTTTNGHNDKFNVDELIRPMQGIYDSLENLSYEWRVEQLQTLRKMVETHKDEFLEALYKDLGKHKLEAILAEYIQITGEIDLTLANLKSWMEEEHVPSPTLIAPCFSKLKPKPLRAPGILVIGPSNYPLSLTLQVAVGTLAAGNPTLIKPSELTPHVSGLTSKYVKQYFGHNKALQVIEGGPEITKTLTQQPWGMIVFTGSERIGKLVAAEAAKTLTPCVLELGGKSPCYVDYDSTKDNKVALDVMANRIIWGKTFNVGQTCVGIDYLIMHEKHVETLGAELVASLQRQFGTNPKESEYGKILTSSPGHAQRAIDLIQQVEQEFEKDGEKKGKILYGGSKTCDASTGYICPTLILNPPRSCRVLYEEIFSPILPILTVSSREEAIDLIQSIRTTQEAGGEGIKSVPLALYVFTNSQKVFDYVTDRVISAAAVQNDAIVHFGNSNLPVGGLGGSCGYGRYHGKFSFATFTHYLPVVSRPCFSGSDSNMMKYHPFDNSWGKGNLIESAIPFLPQSVPVLFRKNSKIGSKAMLEYIFRMLYLIILLLIVGILVSLYLEMNKLQFDSVPMSPSDSKIKITSENLGFTVEL